MLNVQDDAEVALLYYLKVHSKEIFFELVLPCLEFLGFENILYRQKTLVIVGYRPQSASIIHSLEELSSLLFLIENTMMYSNVVIMGDLNIALNKIGNDQLKFVFLKKEHV